MKVKLEIDIKTFATFFAVAAGFVLLWYLITALRGPLTIIFVSFFLALALNPPVSKLSSLLPKHSRIGATALSYVIVISILGGFLVLALPPAVEQTVAFIQEIPGYIEGLQKQSGPLQSFLGQYGLEGQYNDAVQNAQARIGEIAQQIGGSFVGAVGLLFNGIITLFTVLVLTFLMLIEGPAWIKRLWSVYIDEAKREHHKDLATRMYRVVTAYVNGQVLVAAIAAASSLVVLLILSSLFAVPVSAALPLAGIVFFTSMIPMIGSTIGAIVITTVLLFSDISAAVIFLIYFIVYQQVENNVIQPVVQSRSVELSALGVITAVLIGINLAGLLGGLVAIPIAACIRILVNDFLEQRHKQAKVQPENVIHKVKKMLTGSRNDTEETKA